MTELQTDLGKETASTLKCVQIDTWIMTIDYKIMPSDSWIDAKYLQ